MEQPDRNSVCPFRSQNPVSPICCMAPASDATVWAWFPHLLKGLAAVPTFEEPGWLSKTVRCMKYGVWISGRSVHLVISGDRRKKVPCRSSLGLQTKHLGDSLGFSLQTTVELLHGQWVTRGGCNTHLDWE